SIFHLWFQTRVAISTMFLFPLAYRGLEQVLETTASLKRIKSDYLTLFET
ncbi:MAG: hypothetical protein ACI85V_001492, partial [bacterium]